MSEQFLKTRRGIINFYREQLEKFLKLGIGKRTEFDTLVTKKLIDATRRRILQLGGKPALSKVWDAKLITLPSNGNHSTDRVRAFRKRKHILKLKEEINNNGQHSSSNNRSVKDKTGKVGSSKRNEKRGT